MSWLNAVQIVKGPIGSRPAANAVPPNKYGWFATDTLVLSISDGSVWTDIGPGSGGVPTSRTLTAGAALTGGGTLAADRTFDVAVDGSTIEVASDALRVKADGITANEIAAGAVGASELAATAVTPATYGDATHVAQVTVDADGRITSASDVAISGGGGGGGASPLAYSVQTAGTSQNTTSATQADVDATNAVITFTAPASGIVLVRVTCYCQTSGAAGLGRLGLREGTTNIAGPTRVMLGNATIGLQQIAALVWKISGLTPSSSHTYKLAFSTTGGTFTVQQVGSDATILPVTIEVWEG